MLEERGVKVLTKSSKIRDGLGLLRARLKPADGSPPRLLVHRRCAGLIHALLTHHYPEDQPQSEKPVKDGSDHAVDALRYMVLHLDGAPRRVSAATHDQHMVNTWSTRDQPVITR